MKKFKPGVRNWAFIYFCILALSIGLSACNSNGSAVKVKPNRNEWGSVLEMNATLSAPNKADLVGQILFDTDTLKLGNVPARSYITKEVGFSIAGEGPVVILSCQSSCGCTAPKCPKLIYHPGDKGSFPVKFRSTNQAPGPFEKVVKVKILGTPNKKQIVVTGVVLPEEKTE